MKTPQWLKNIGNHFATNPKLWAIVGLIVISIIIGFWLCPVAPKSEGNTGNATMAAGIHDLNTALPRPVTKMIGKDWYSVYLRDDHSIAKMITPEEDNVKWRVMFNDDTNQIIHMPARNDPIGRYVVNTNVPRSVKISLEPDAPVQVCEFSWDQVPR